MQFIPEMRQDLTGQLFRAAAGAVSIGMAPFGIDSAPEDLLETIARVYRQIGAVAPLLSARPAHERRAFDVTADQPHVDIDMGEWAFTIERDFDPQGEGQDAGYGLRLYDGERFVLAGYGVVLHARHRASTRPGWVMSCTELSTPDVTPVRELNGDKTGGGTHIRITRDAPPGFGPIPIAGSRTGVLSFTLYPRPV